jgi:hypothetical protein
MPHGTEIGHRRRKIAGGLASLKGADVTVGTLAGGSYHGRLLAVDDREIVLEKLTGSVVVLRRDALVAVTSDTSAQQWRNGREPEEVEP